MRQLILIGLVISSFYVTGQLNRVVHLKNGSAIRGEVLQNDSTCVRLRTRDGSYWNFSADEVDFIQKYRADIPTRGFYNRTSAGILTGDSFDVSMRVVNGYTLNEHWEFGFGLGIESLRWNSYVPFFLESRYTLFKGSSRPFLAIHTGYVMPVRNMEFNKGGFTGGIEFGIVQYFSRHIGITTSLGYRFSYLVQKNGWWEDYTTITQMNRFEIRLGFVFR